MAGFIGDGGNQLGFGARPDRARILGIDAEQLLATCHEPRLQRRRAVAHRDQIGIDPVNIAQQGSQFPALAIITDDPDQRNRQAQRGEVARHIACAARHGCLAGPPHDRHRRFRRNARHAAIDEPVEHDVADTDDALAGSGMNETRKMCA